MTDSIRAAFRFQADFCDRSDAPITARVCIGLASSLNRDSETGRRVLDWPGEPIADALPLRLVGGLHALHRAGADAVLSAVFSGTAVDAKAVARTLTATLVTHDTALLPWLEGPPQTNEAGRAAALMTGLLHLAARHGPRFELLEIGSSAGLNLLIGRYRIALDGVCVGPVDSPVLLRPAWRGPPPPAAAVRIERARGVDIAPLDVTRDADAARLAAYAWVDAEERQARLAAAIGMVRVHGIDLVQGEAADWVEARLAEPQADGVTRVLMHSVVWQYLPPATQARIAAAMTAAGAQATAARPLGWVRMEPERELARYPVTISDWPGGDWQGGDWPGGDWPGGDTRDVALVHPHGTWIEGLG